MVTNFKLDRDLIIIDVETSGVSEESSVIQLGAYRFSKHGKLIREEYFNSFIIPYLSEWSQEAFNIHKISQEFLEKAGFNVKEVLIDFSKWVYRTSARECYIAQWSCGFDTSMLQRAYKKAEVNYPFTYRSYDISSIVRFYLACHGFNPSKGLGDCARILGLDLREFKAHDALEDARMTGLVLEKVIENVLEKTDKTV